MGAETVGPTEGIPDKDLEQWIGPDAAQALRQHKDELGEVIQYHSGHVISGNVPTNTMVNTQASRGMSQFYDQTLPNKLRKLLEPFGGTVELEPLASTHSTVPGSTTLSGAPYPREVQAWIARLSPEMKQAILKKGFPVMALYGLMNPGSTYDQK